jgi:hypothetical protein
MISQLFYANEEQVYDSVNDIPTDVTFFEAKNPAYFTYDSGVLVITETIPLQKGADILEGLLSVTVDLGTIPIPGGNTLPNQSVRAEYREMQDGMVVFRGSARYGGFWVVDSYYSGSSFGIVGEFVMIFVDETGSFSGCRVFSNGYFSTDPTPDQYRQSSSYPMYNPPYAPYGSDGVFIDVYGEACGAECGETDASIDTDGCEGDSYSDDSGGCGGDSYSDNSSGSDCEGDTGGNDSGCEGDTSTSESGCETASYHNGSPLRALSRWLPELIVLALVSYGRSKARRNCSAGKISFGGTNG